MFPSWLLEKVVYIFTIKWSNSKLTIERSSSNRLIEAQHSSVCGKHFSVDSIASCETLIWCAHGEERTGWVETEDGLDATASDALSSETSNAAGTKLLAFH